MRQRNIPRRRGMNCLQENRDRSTLRPRFFAFIFPIQKGGHAQMERYEYPFSALVGQEKLKTALLLNLVEPRLGGVLIQGEKGTAKSTAVRRFGRADGRGGGGGGVPLPLPDGW